jgi:uncharacterized membrane protein HdeD (DUF308 family)
MAPALVVPGLPRFYRRFRSGRRVGSTGSDLSTGIVEVVGGVLIYLNPLQGAVAMIILIAIVVLIQGFAQITFALKVRRDRGWLLVAGMIVLLASAALLSHFPFSDHHEPRVVTGILLLLAGCCYVANALTTKRGVSTLRSDHLRHRTFALLEEKDGSIDRKIKISSFQSPINFARIAYRTNSAVDEIPSLRIADAR